MKVDNLLKLNIKEVLNLIHLYLSREIVFHFGQEFKENNKNCPNFTKCPLLAKMGSCNRFLGIALVNKLFAFFLPV